MKEKRALMYSNSYMYFKGVREFFVGARFLAYILVDSISRNSIYRKSNWLFAEKCIQGSSLQ
jgi:hypothetical protein